MTVSQNIAKQDITSEQLVDVVFKEFFTEGEKMSRLRKEKISDNTEKIIPFKVGHYDFVKEKVKPMMQDNWWWWKLCYTDGKSISLFTMKGWEDMQHAPSIDEPWF